MIINREIGTKTAKLGVVLVAAFVVCNLALGME
jgi:hypothetical protein